MGCACAILAVLTESGRLELTFEEIRMGGLRRGEMQDVERRRDGGAHGGEGRREDG